MTQGDQAQARPLVYCIPGFHGSDRCLPPVCSKTPYLGAVGREGVVHRGQDEPGEEAADVEAGRAVHGELWVDDLDCPFVLVDHDAPGVEVAVTERAVLGHL